MVIVVALWVLIKIVHQCGRSPGHTVPRCHGATEAGVNRILSMAFVQGGMALLRHWQRCCGSVHCSLLRTTQHTSASMLHNSTCWYTTQIARGWCALYVVHCPSSIVACARAPPSAFLCTCRVGGLLRLEGRASMGLRWSSGGSGRSGSSWELLVRCRSMSCYRWHARRVMV